VLTDGNAEVLTANDDEDRAVSMSQFPRILCQFMLILYVNLFRLESTHYDADEQVYLHLIGYSINSADG